MNESQSNSQAAQIYRSYLVRFWQSYDKGHWRASAQCVQTGSTLLFCNVESLLDYLQNQVAADKGEDSTFSKSLPVQ